ncbi:MAG: hypothetical protein JW884_11950 [Deltaproteobacteria bacterium]|nr:hypothetical protein [Deltaproteobacteria bacterium]
MFERKISDNPLGYDTKRYTEDTATGRRYRFIVGGFAWPLKGKPGHIVVLGEDDQEDAVLRKHPIRVLAECPKESVIDLLQKGLDCNKQFCVDEWVGDTENMAMMGFMDKISLPLSKAKMIDDLHQFEGFLNMIKECTAPGKKVLQFGQESRLPDYLHEVTATKGESVENHPPVAALGYALAEIYLRSDPSAVQRDNEILNKIVEARCVDGI